MALASCPVSGCSTADETTNELAIHTYCDAPPTESVIPGSAVVMTATSSAEIKDSRQRATKVPQKRKWRVFMVAVEPSLTST